MKRWITLLGILITAGIRAQDDGQSLFSTVRPDALVIVTEHPTGAEIVQVTVLPKGYPSKLLKEQIDKIAQELGSTARGIKMTQPNLGTKAQFSFLRAEFATDGLIDREKGIVRLEPIVKAFAGAPAPYTIGALKIMFEGERTTKKMIRNYPVKDVLEIEGRSSANPPGIEYQVKLLSQDPAAISIPEEYRQEPNQKPVQEPSSSPNLGLLIGLFVVAGLAVGALVYLALLRTGGTRR